MWERKVFRVVGKLKGKRPHGDWFKLAQDRGQW
jgi:hypothetical protein